MASKGLAGKILWVDLTEEAWWTEDTIDYKEFIGGRGIGSWLVFREVPVSADPLSPDNIITFNSGPLTGTLAPFRGLNISTEKSYNGGFRSQMPVPLYSANEVRGF